MYQQAKGYYSVDKNVIQPHMYYILSLKKARKPVLIKLACKSATLAKKFILCNKHPEIFEVITGEQALDRGISFGPNATMQRAPYPSKYGYPPEVGYWKRKQYRTEFRRRMRKAFEIAHTLKQFTLKHKGRVFTIHHWSYQKAYEYICKHTNKLSWESFIKRVSIKPRNITKEIFFIKSSYVSLESINQFNKHHNVKRINRIPNSGKIPRSKEPRFPISFRKPKSMVF